MGFILISIRSGQYRQPSPWPLLYFVDTLIWLVPINKTVETTSFPIGPCQGWKRSIFCGCHPASMRRPWGRKAERKGACVVLFKPLSVSDLSLHVLAPDLFFRAKWGHTNDKLTMLPLHFMPEVSSILCLSLWQLIMMSVLSYLLGSAWLLISGQHSTVTFLSSLFPPDHQRAFFSSFFPPFYFLRHRSFNLSRVLLADSVQK